MITMDKNIRQESLKEYQRRLTEINDAIDRVMDVEAKGDRLLKQSLTETWMAVNDFKRVLRDVL